MDGGDTYAIELAFVLASNIAIAKLAENWNPRRAHRSPVADTRITLCVTGGIIEHATGSRYCAVHLLTFVIRAGDIFRTSA